MATYTIVRAGTVVVNTVNWSQSVDLGIDLQAGKVKAVSVYSDQKVLVRFQDASGLTNTDSSGNRTVTIRAGQSKTFNLEVNRYVYLAKDAVADPNATVDVEALI